MCVVKVLRKETALLEEVLTDITQQSLTEEHLEGGWEGGWSTMVRWMCVSLAEVASTLKQCQNNQRDSVSLLSSSLSLSSQTMAVCPEVEQIIAEWYTMHYTTLCCHIFALCRWDQPAMKLVHWIKVEDMSLEQWLDQWRVLAANYRQLQCT